ncbi:hypothetical protein [Profundibacter sp.]|uniref:hypothetical protein n=1 Tax=Profundibacter sp. TaxID=3101071 RepID=UPI003D0DCAF5
MIRSNQAGQAKNRPPRREEGENGNLQRFPVVIISSDTCDFRSAFASKSLIKALSATALLSVAISSSVCSAVS